MGAMGQTDAGALMLAGTQRREQQDELTCK
jgi:hypothetical protein